MKNRCIDREKTHIPFPYEIRANHLYYKCPYCEKKLDRFEDVRKCKKCGQKLSWKFSQREVPEEFTEERLRLSSLLHFEKIKIKEYKELCLLLLYQIYTYQFKRRKKASHKKQTLPEHLHFFKKIEKKYNFKGENNGQ